MHYNKTKYKVYGTMGNTSIRLAGMKICTITFRKNTPIEQLVS